MRTDTDERPEGAALLRHHLGPEEWLVPETGFSAERSAVVETLFTVANGRMGTRGTHEEGTAPGELSGTFINGVYDAHDARGADLVNAPDWLPCLIHVDGVALDLTTCTVVSHERALDFRHGLLWRSTVFADEDGNRTRLESLRFVSMARRELAVQRVVITPLDRVATVSVDVRIDGQRRNLDRLAVYAPGTVFAPEAAWEKWARARHLGEVARRTEDGLLYLETRTLQTDFTVGYAAATDYSAAPDRRDLRQRAFQVDESTVHEVAAGQPLVVDRFVAIHTSRDTAPESVADLCARDATEARTRGFDACLAETREAWEELWADCDVRIVGDPVGQHAMRYGIYQLLIAVNPDDPTVNIGAKSLTGEGYRGHVFWDTEVLMLPFFVYTQPEAARSLLQYRYQRLPAARILAEESGCRGARFPWESADTGLEECPQWTDDGAFRFWSRDEEIHVSADIAYAVIVYVIATGDTQFLLDHGAELLFEGSRFWVTRATPNEGKDTYSIRQVMGPDEFHSHVDDNAFTNLLARWSLRESARIYDELAAHHPAELGRLAERIGLEEAEIDEWRRVAAALVTGIDPETGLVEQFEGYFQREDVAIAEWDDNGMPRYPEGYHHFNCEDTTLLKQPDAVMAMHMLPDEFDRETKRKNFEFYEPRTLHKSSLSAGTHAIMGIEVGDHTRALDYFARSALVDLSNNQGNTREGIHIASAAGTWQILVHGFGGFRVRHGQLCFDPWLPDQWEEIGFRLRWRGRRIDVAIGQDAATFVLDAEPGVTDEIRVRDRVVTLTGGQSVRVALDTPALSEDREPAVVSGSRANPTREEKP